MGMTIGHKVKQSKKLEQQVIPPTSANLRALAPPMPPKILATLHEDWNALDPEAERMLNWIHEVRVFHEFAHARDPFYVHLRGTWQMLACWNQPQDVCRCGLLHSAYSRDGFNFRFFNIQESEARELLRGVIGEPAENLVHNYCSTWDTQGWGPAIARGEPLNEAGYDIPSRLDPRDKMHMSAADMAKLLVILVADVADQLTERISYRDVYHHEDPDLNWPGSGKPGVMYYVFSRALKSARPFLEVVPPVFNDCTEILDLAEEEEAANLYWRTMQEESNMSTEERAAAYRKVSELNPYVAEPHVMLSQELYRQGRFAEAVHEAACALDVLYQWGTCWDKRTSFAQWVGFARMMLLRSKRRLLGLTSLPSQKLSETAGSGSEPVIYLQDVVNGFSETTEGIRARL